MSRHDLDFTYRFRIGLPSACRPRPEFLNAHFGHNVEQVYGVPTPQRIGRMVFAFGDFSGSGGLECQPWIGETTESPSPFHVDAINELTRLKIVKRADTLPIWAMYLGSKNMQTDMRPVYLGLDMDESATLERLDAVATATRDGVLQDHIVCAKFSALDNLTVRIERGDIHELQPAAWAE
ncbi:MAG: hypothetical protein WBP26_02165 [Candidatus Saccharimonadales bacterium]